MITLPIVALWLALAGTLAWIFRLIALDSPRAPLPRHAGQTRRAAVPAAAPDEEPVTPVAGSGGTAPYPPVPGAVPLPLAVETPALYNTGELTRLSEHTEGWWSQ